MNIDAKITFEEQYLPTKRHRIPRTREVEESVQIELREFSKKDAPVAMVVTNYNSYLDEDGNDHFALRDTPYLVVDGELYTEKRDMRGSLDEGPFTMDKFLHAIKREGDCTWSWHQNKDKESILQDLKDFIGSHVLVDGVFFERAGEPRYVIHTFGLGHNHGGTSLSITHYYNENISKDRYFNALQRDDAVAYAVATAKNRGDTEDVEHLSQPKKNIQVFMPEMVRCSPNLEHGDGNPLLNSMEAMVRAGSDTLESGLLAVAAVAAHSSTENLTSFTDKLQDASSRANESRNTTFKRETEKTPDRSI